MVPAVLRGREAARAILISIRLFSYSATGTSGAKVARVDNRGAIRRVVASALRVTNVAMTAALIAPPELTTKVWPCAIPPHCVECACLRHA